MCRFFLFFVFLIIGEATQLKSGMKTKNLKLAMLCDLQAVMVESSLVLPSFSAVF